MANPYRGEVSFKSGDKEYTLRMSINVMCELDDALGVPDAFNQLFVAGRATLKQMRTLFFLSLRKQHPDIADEETAGDLVIAGELAKLLETAVKRQSADKENGGGERPQMGEGQ